MRIWVRDHESEVKFEVRVIKDQMLKVSGQRSERSEVRVERSQNSNSKIRIFVSKAYMQVSKFRTL